MINFVFKRSFYSLTIILLVLILGGCSQKEKIPVTFFFMEVCPGCENYQKAEFLSGLVVSLVKSDTYGGRSFNMAFQDEKGNEVLFDILETLNLPDISYSLPLLFVGNEYFVGYEEIEVRLLELIDK